MMEWSEQAARFFAKAEENIASAADDLAAGRYNACANRCYYAAFHAAIAALIGAGVRPPRDRWGHDFVQAQIAGELVNRRKEYPPEYKEMLPRLFELRRLADYQVADANPVTTRRALERAVRFVEAVKERRA